MSSYPGSARHWGREPSSEIHLKYFRGYFEKRSRQNCVPLLRGSVDPEMVILCPQMRNCYLHLTSCKPLQKKPAMPLLEHYSLPYKNNAWISLLAGSTVITWYKGDRIVSAGSLKILNEPRFNVLTSPDGSVTLAIRKVTVSCSGGLSFSTEPI